MSKLFFYIRNNQMSERTTPETDAAWSCIRGHTELLHDVKNLSRKLERQRDEARELLYALESKWKTEVEFAAKISVKRDELLDILRKLLEIIPEPECHDFGHTKEERHDFLEKCPVLARYDAIITQAKEAVK